MKRSGLIRAVVIVLVLTGSVRARELAEYRIGDTLDADLVAPVPLKVVNPEATLALKQKESLRVPAIFRFDPATADKVEADFCAAFESTRSNFLRRVQVNFHRRKLDDKALATPKYERVAGSLLKQKRPLPVSTNLLETWARGESGRVVRSSVIARLREKMTHPIRPDFLPAGFKLSGRLRFVTVSNRDQALTLAEAEEHGRLTSRTNLLVLWRVRKELIKSFPPEELKLARFAAATLQSNCLPDAELTWQARARYTASLFSADNYEAGQVIARRGQVVNAKIKAAITQLIEQTALNHLQRQVGEEQAVSARIRRERQRLWTGFSAVTLVLIISLTWLMARGRKRASLLPARVAGGGNTAGIISCPSCDENIIVPAEAVENLSANAAAWQQRALAAEQRAKRAQAAIRDGVLPHFTEWLKQVFIQRLFSERKQMLDAQKSATAELAELEQRLDELHAPLQERFQAYEKRIADLEKSLEVKGEENRKLLRLRIQLTRQQLAAERARNRVELN